MSDLGHYRLLKLADHIEFGTLAHKVFDMSHFNHGVSVLQSRNRCGTSGCMAGELPYLFPEIWRWDLDFVWLVSPPRQFIQSKSLYLLAHDLACFFGISELDAEGLFYEHDSSERDYDRKFHADRVRALAKLRFGDKTLYELTGVTCAT